MQRRYINGRYPVIMPDHVAGWDALSAWEDCRFTSMENTLKPGHILFDVGAEQGYMSAVYARFVGGENMVLLEPVPQVWPNIRQTWEANRLPRPLCCWVGLLSDRTDLTPPHLDIDPAVDSDGWPVCATGPIYEAVSFRLLTEHVASTPQSTVDAWVAAHRIVPDALTIDVEGAELKILAGAQTVLAEHRPLVWCSVHPDMIERFYGQDPFDLWCLMRDLGYQGRHLCTDHEEHVLFTPVA